MKVYINTKDTKLFIPIPNAMVFNSVVKRYLFKQIEKNDAFTLTKEQKEIMEKLFKMMRKKYKGLKIVEVRTGDNEIIEITI